MITLIITINIIREVDNEPQLEGEDFSLGKNDIYKNKELFYQNENN